MESVAKVCEVASAKAPINILVNNAGIHLSGALESLEQDGFKHVLDINLLGAWRLTKAALPHMPDGGMIVMISSLSGLVGLQDDGAYAAGKFAVEGMSQSFAAELAPRRIRVIVFEPEVIATGFAGAKTGVSPETMAKDIAGIVQNPRSEMRYPLGEMGEFVSDQLLLDRGNRAEAIVKRITGNGW